ncbi:MAG TPA: hypothetical protein VKP12_08955, partial [Kiloniellaceae bacterium]|nr:hypothetical protein [Kiloniellaceae bacterium]
MNALEFVGDYRQPQLSARQRALGHDASSAGEFTFGDFLDIINPLQHIPIVSNIYREITGDEISPHARILGDTLFGGPTGFLASIANVLYEEIAGEDVGETALALFTGDDAVEADPQVADAGGLVEPAAALPQAAAPLETAAGSDLPVSADDPGTAPPELPEPPAGVLTGQDALDALFMDLSGRRPNAAAIPVERAAPESIPLPGRAGDGKAARSYPLPARPAPASNHASPPAPAPSPAMNAATPESGVNPLLFAQE